MCGGGGDRLFTPTYSYREVCRGGVDITGADGFGIKLDWFGRIVPLLSGDISHRNGNNPFCTATSRTGPASAEIIHLE